MHRLQIGATALLAVPGRDAGARGAFVQEVREGREIRRHCRPCAQGCAKSSLASNSVSSEAKSLAKVGGHRNPGFDGRPVCVERSLLGCGEMQLVVDLVANH